MHFNAPKQEYRKWKPSYNPIKLLANTLLFGYQNILSEQIQANCGFEPSCSQFSKEAINELGFIRGIFLTADRLTRCNGQSQEKLEDCLVNHKTGRTIDSPNLYR